MNQIIEQLRQNGLSRISADIQSMALPSIRITARPTEDEKLTVGQSKFGGRPDLPANISWPRFKNAPLAFVAQIQLANVITYDPQHKLPQSGLLSFFYDARQETYGDNAADRDGWKVIYTKGNDTPLTRLSIPDGLPASAQYKASTLQFASELTLPLAPTDYQKNLQLSDAESKAYDGFLANFPKEDAHKVSRHRMLGYPDQLQDDMRTEAQLASNAVTGHDPRAAALAEGAAEWQLLLQVDTDEHAGIHWSDAGMIYYWIEQRKLQEQNFDDVWLVLQTT